LLNTLIDYQNRKEFEEFKKLYGGTVHLYGGIKSHNVSLGCLNCPTHDILSIWNVNSSYGINFSSKENNIWNELGDFGGTTSNYSPWNLEGEKAPVIVDLEGNFYGYFSANAYHDYAIKDESLLKLIQDFYYIRDNYEKVGKLFAKE
jgi:hypothetical protein